MLGWSCDATYGLDSICLVFRYSRTRQGLEFVVVRWYGTGVERLVLRRNVRSRDGVCGLLTVRVRVHAGYLALNHKVVTCRN